jgi:predicted HD phosphohydrolase
MADGQSNQAQAGRRPPFRAMTEGDHGQWMEVARADAAFAQGLPTWLMANLNLLKGDCHGFAVDRLEHCLQTATRAHRAGRDEEYVACALIHDIGATLAPEDHAEFGAMILRPYISERNHWMMRHHGIFQGYYFFHFFGMDRDEREQFRGHPHFEYTAEFCHQFDQNAFDPDYPSMPLDAFEPILRRVLGRRHR